MYKKITCIKEEYGDNHIRKEKYSEEREVIYTDVPLFLRLLEYARESPRDIDLHIVAKNAAEMSEDGMILGVEHYDKICNITTVKIA